jgi:hypothetical protein
MARFILSLMELGVSATVHMLFGLYVFSTAVAADISQAAAASGCLLLRRPPPAAAGSTGGALVDVAAAGESDELRGAAPVILDASPPPIVLVHGIFGFGKGVRSQSETLSLSLSKLSLSLSLSLSLLFSSSLPGGGGECLVKCRGGSVLTCFPLRSLLPCAEARWPLLLRRRREEGRPRARAGFGVAHQHP